MKISLHPAATLSWQLTDSLQNAIVETGLTVEPSAQDCKVDLLGLSDSDTLLVGGGVARPALFGVQVDFNPQLTRLLLE